MTRSIIAICVIVLGGLVFLSNYNSPTTVVGEVYMEEGETAPFAEINIYSADNMKLVTSTLADTDGNFSLDNLNSGNYVLEVSYVGYKNYKTPLIINSDRETSTGSIELEYDFDEAEFAAHPDTRRPIRS